MLVHQRVTSFWTILWALNLSKHQKHQGGFNHLFPLGWCHPKCHNDQLSFFFPTSLCGVLVFDSVSRWSAASSASCASSCHTLSFTLNFVAHHLSTQLCHTPSDRRGTWRHPPSFHVAGAALGDIHLRFAWQEHLATSTFFAWCGGFGTWWHPRREWVHLSQIRLSYTKLCHAQSFTSLSLTHIATFRAQLCHTHNSFAHNFFTHLSHTQLCHPQLCHTQSFTHSSLTCNFSLTHIFVTHHLSDTHTIFLTHNFVKRTIFHTQLCLLHTTLHIQLLNWSILHHLLCPFFCLRAASTTSSDCWKKLTCGVIRPFNSWGLIDWHSPPLPPRRFPQFNRRGRRAPVVSSSSSRTSCWT